MGGKNQRLICTSFCIAFVLVTLGAVYFVWRSEDPFAQVTYYAVSADNTIQRIWRHVRDSYAPSPYIDKHYLLPLEDRSCNASHPVNESFIKNQEIVQKRRRKILNHACMKYLQNQTSRPQLASTRVSVLLEEYPYHVTSQFTLTDWNRAFKLLSQLEPKYGQILIKTPQNENEFTLQGVTTFMFSRHPFSRLLSSYFFRIGPRATKEQMKTGNYAGNYEKLHEQIVKRFPEIYTTRKDITDFRSFIFYVLENEYFDDINLTENYKLLSPCEIPYNIIGKSETLKKDAKFILESVGAHCFVDFAVFDQSGLSGVINTDLLLKYYQTLSKEVIEKLYHRYRLDFLLFDYSFEITINGELLRFPPES